jgi:hypothetical protein
LETAQIVRYQHGLSLSFRRLSLDLTLATGWSRSSDQAIEWTTDGTEIDHPVSVAIAKKQKRVFNWEIDTELPMWHRHSRAGASLQNSIFNSRLNVCKMD